MSKIMNKRGLLFCATLLGIALFSMAPIWPVLLNSDFGLLTRDCLRGLLPLKYIWLKAMHAEGIVPLWNYAAIGGTPYLADPYTSALFPLNSILLFFSLENFVYAFSWYIASHFPFLFFSFYLLLRTLRIPQAQALLWSFAYCFSAVVISSTHTPSLLSGEISMPLSIALWIRYCRSGQLRFLWTCSLAIAISVYGAAPEHGYFLCLGLFLYTAVYYKKKLGMFLVMGLGVLMSSAPQLLPTLDLMQETPRFHLGFDKQEVFFNSFHPIRAIESIFPLYMGNYVPQNSYWGGPFINGPFKTPFLFSSYLGVLTIFTLFMGIALYFPKRSFSKQLPTKLLILSFIAFFFALGSYNVIPLYDWLVDYLPGWKNVRYPEKKIYFMSFFLQLAAAVYLRRILLLTSISNNIKPRIVLFPLIGAFIVGAGTLIYIVFGISMKGLAISTILPSFIHLFIFLGIVSILWFFYLRKNVSAQLLLLILFFVVVFDQLSVGRGLLWEQPKTLVNSSVAAFIKKDLQNRKAELQSGGSRRFSPAAVHLIKPDNWQDKLIPASLDEVGREGWRQSSKLIPLTNVIHDIESVTGYGILHSYHHIDFWDRAKIIGPSKFYGILGAHYILTKTADQKLGIQKYRQALPYAFLAPGIEIRKSREAVLTRLQDWDFPWRKTVLIESLKKFNGEGLSSGTVKIQARTSSRFSVHLKLKSPKNPAFFVWNESFHKYWQASVEGQPVRIFRANGWAMAIQIPIRLVNNQSIKIEFNHINPHFEWGEILMLIWMMVGIGCFYIKRRQPDSLTKTSSS